jgi:hypothetical protein
MLDILTYLPAKRKTTPSGWTSFNAVCCAHMGQNADRRQRGGIKVSDQGWTYHCFNCGYTASFILGRNLSFKARKVLTWLGMSESDIERLNLENLRHRNINGIIDDRRRVFESLADISFEEHNIEDNNVFSELEFVTPQHQQHWQYLKSRCVIENYPYMADASDGRPNIIIPFTYNNTVVGHTRRFLDDRRPKYITDSQPGYVFGTDLQKQSWQHVIVVEGIFDALSISGLAVMHNTISDTQARLIRSLGKDVIVVPDHDKAGLELVDRAVELNWSVSMPDWPPDIKDVNDAVVKLGKLATMLTIMQSRERNKIKIELRKKNFAQRLRN